ncbi:hypothetical protein D6774_01080 [Candidatus Woesearchaeota archaeon]|nr:MAG: hypothetical protein D6774_01080 [Candidatus Woesearchaeota archaeon]
MEDGTYEYECRAVMVGRLPRRGDDPFKTVSIKLFKEDDPHKKGELPFEELEIPNIEKVRFRHLFVTYYLEGNDLIINHLHKLHMVKEGSKIVLRGIQGSY